MHVRVQGGEEDQVGGGVGGQGSERVEVGGAAGRPVRAGKDAAGGGPALDREWLDEIEDGQHIQESVLEEWVDNLNGLLRHRPVWFPAWSTDLTRYSIYATWYVAVSAIMLPRGEG